MTNQELQAKRDYIAKQLIKEEEIGLRYSYSSLSESYIEGVKFLLQLDNLIEAADYPFQSYAEPEDLADEAAKAEARAAMEAELAKVAERAANGLPGDTTLDPNLAKQPQFVQMLEDSVLEQLEEVVRLQLLAPIDPSDDSLTIKRKEAVQKLLAKAAELANQGE